MRAEALRDLTTEELNERVGELREQLLKLRFQKSTGQIEDPQTLRSVRKDIARAQTVLRERQIKRRRDKATEAAASLAAEQE